MKEWYRGLKIEYRVVIWSLIVILSLIILSIPLFFFSWMEIPQGIALGGGVAIVIYLLLGLFNKESEPRKTITITAIIVTVKLLLIGGLLFLVGWLYYSVGFKAFNIFAVAGGYFIPLIIHLILVRKEK